MNNTIEKFFICQCNTEGVLVSKFSDEEEVYMAMYAHNSYSTKSTLKDKLKFILRYIKTGKLYADEIVMSKQTANELGNYLISITK